MSGHLVIGTKDGVPYVIEASDEVLCTPELLGLSNGAIETTVRICGTHVYRVVGWDEDTQTLKLRRKEDG
jgi:hypothetical protein